MKKINLVIAAGMFIAAGLTGCKKDVIPETYIGAKTSGPYAIGDVVYSDGSADAYTAETAADIKTKMDKAVALIYQATDGETQARGIGLKQDFTELKFCSKNSVFAQNSTDYAPSTSDSDGSDNYTNLINMSEYAVTSTDYENLDQYPLFKSAYNTKYDNEEKGTWFIPESDEYMLLSTNTTIGGTLLGTALYEVSNHKFNGTYACADVPADNKTQYRTVAVSNEGKTCTKGVKDKSNGMVSVMCARIYPLFTDENDTATYIGAKKPGNYAEGDVIYNDDSADTYENWIAKDSSSRQNPVAFVIVKLNTKTEKYVYAFQTRLSSTVSSATYWCKSDAYGYDKFIRGLSESNYLYYNDGVKIDFNKQILMFKYNQNDFELEDLYPAFKYANNYTCSIDGIKSSYKSGWYIPGTFEAYSLFESYTSDVKNIYKDLTGKDIPSIIYTTSTHITSGAKAGMFYMFGVNSATSASSVSDVTTVRPWVLIHKF